MAGTLPSPADAALDNARWCATVWSSLGIPRRDDRDFVVARARTPAGFPELVTLRPEVDSARVRDAVADLPQDGISVKDSFHDLALTPYGFRVLLDGSWIARAPSAAPTVSPSGAQTEWETVTGPEELAAWAAGRDTAAAFHGRLLRRACVELVRHRADPHAGFALTVSPVVVGVSNVRVGALDPAQVWSSLITFCARRLPGRGLVGWETPEDLDAPLAAGFTRIGRLRVWIS